MIASSPWPDCRPEIAATRSAKFGNLTGGDPLDALVVGGGITGTPVYAELCRRGYRTGLVDGGDFASGTSQASGMMIWGGLLYLKNLDLATVVKLCRARKALMEQYPEKIGVLDLRYVDTGGSRAGRFLVRLGLYFYWLLGGFKLRRPSGLGFQEGMLRESDSRFVIELLRAFDSEHCLPLNYCRLMAAEFAPDQRCWNATLRDQLTGVEHSVKAKVILNGAGIWTDEVNEILGVKAPYKHVLSKGVYLAFPRPREHTEARVYPMEGADDVLTHVPWGPVSMWGPTETAVGEIEPGLAPSRDDLRFLLGTANRSLPGKVGPEDVVSIRCGIRPLAVPQDYCRQEYPLELSRCHRMALDRDRQTISIYGGKFTSSFQMAEQAANLVRKWIAPRYSPPKEPQELQEPPETVFSEEFQRELVSPSWARDREYCVTLEDYLRRRTPIAQWTPRMGLGREGSHRESLVNRESLKRTAQAFTPDAARAELAVLAYEEKVKAAYDPLLAV